MRPGYSVTVSKNGEPILTIGPDLSGLSEFSDEDANAIRDAGEHLLSFIGPAGPHECFACGGSAAHRADCPLGELAATRD